MLTAMFRKLWAATSATTPTTSSLPYG
jgi:hypothetical protein